MATISVWKNATTKLGTGDGNINTTEHTATITKWKSEKDKAGLQANTKYELHEGNRTYTNATCTQVNLPAKFTGLQ